MKFCEIVKYIRHKYLSILAFISESTTDQKQSPALERFQPLENLLPSPHSGQGTCLCIACLMELHAALA